jgi:hypothetical protein
MDNGNIEDSIWEERIADALARRREANPSDASSTIYYAYVGPVNQDKVHSLVSEIEEILIEAEVGKAKVKKTFTILLEGLQNMAIHSTSASGTRYVGLEVSALADDINIQILGLADAEAVEKVTQVVSRLNAMDRAEIKSHYLNVMENGEMSAKGGAGLGLITMVMKSKEGMEVASQSVHGNMHILAHDLKV